MAQAWVSFGDNALEGLASGQPIDHILGMILASVERRNPRWMVAVCTRSPPPQDLLHVVSNTLQSDLITRVLQHLARERPILGQRLVREFDEPSFTLETPRDAPALSLRSFWAEPLRGLSGQSLGWLCFLSPSRIRATGLELLDAAHAARTCSVAIETATTQSDLKENFSYLSEAQGIAQVGSWRLKLDTGSILWSNETYRIFDVPPNSPITLERFFDLVHRDDRARVEEAWNAALAGADYDVVHRIVTGDRVRWVRERANITFDDRKVPRLAVGTVQDITEQRESLERLKLASSVFQHSQEGIVVVDDRVKMVDANRAFCEMTGYSREELLGQNPNLLKSGHQPPEFYADMWKTLAADGAWRGEVWNRRKSGELYAEQLTISAVQDEFARVHHYVGVVSDITHLKHQQDRLERLAHHDALTMLPNRLLLADRLQQAIARSKRESKIGAVGFLDLDGFKPVNDRYGHGAGDSVLQEVASRIQKAIRECDTVARVGGDEFVVVLAPMTGIDECITAAQRILSVINRPIRLPEANVLVSTSIGLAIFPRDGSDGDTLVRHADQAMYFAKRAGSNRLHLFGEDAA
jgi:diguanylate cyclase (GGDEF)-like protein/PAS domain S-box-containing protein